MTQASDLDILARDRALRTWFTGDADPVLAKMGCQLKTRSRYVPFGPVRMLVSCKQGYR